MSSFLPVPPGSIATVVTHLEMFEQPKALPGKPRPGLHLRRVREPSLDWYRSLYRRIGEQWLWFSRILMTDEQLLAVIHHPNEAVYALQDGDQEIGLLELNWRQAPECEIALFGLTPDATGGGAGAWMMGQAQRIAFDEERAARVWLHTCTLDHPRALPFYVNQGFKAFRREVEIAPDPRLSGNICRNAAAFHPIIDVHDANKDRK